jgi:hypothetical protein
VATALWFRTSFHDTGSTTLHALSTQTCFHLVNAPQFISLQGSRIWVNLDGQWTTTDKTERDQSRDPRHVTLLKQGLPHPVPAPGRCDAGISNSSPDHVL